MTTQTVKTELLKTILENRIPLADIRYADVFIDDGTDIHVVKRLDDDLGSFLEAIDRPYTNPDAEPPECFYTFQRVYGRVWLTDGRWLNREFDTATETESWAIRNDPTEIPRALIEKK